jgi:signal transduction histidine kinase
MSRTRRYARDSFPVELGDLGLKKALDSLCHGVTKQTTCRCIYTWSAPDASPLTPAQDINIYRIIQEALQNAVKHAKANRITVDVRAEGKTLILSVCDNGTGDPRLNEENPVITEKKHAGLGLRSMRYRAHQLGAEYTLVSAEQGGTQITVRIPL